MNCGLEKVEAACSSFCHFVTDSRVSETFRHFRIILRFADEQLGFLADLFVEKKIHFF